MPTGSVRPQMTSRRSTPHVSSKRVSGTRRLRRRGVPEEYLPPSRGPKGLLPYHQQTAPAEPKTKMLESAPQVRLLEYPEDGPIYGVVPLYELPGIDQSLYMALSYGIIMNLRTGRIEELYDSGGGSLIKVKFLIIPSQIQSQSQSHLTRGSNMMAIRMTLRYQATFLFYLMTLKATVPIQQTQTLKRP